MNKFTPTPKQQEFIDSVLCGKYNFLFYGGAAGGGKSYVGLATLVLLSKLFPGSRWCVVRKDYAKLKQNTLPSFNKLVPTSFLVNPKKPYVDGTVYFNNGSQIIFKGENYNYDKDLTWLDGFECNGFLLEEVQELSKKMFEKAKLRAGRHIIEPMPPILLLLTGNPSQNWSKDEFVIPAKENRLKDKHYYLPALMTDNPYIPQEYLDNVQSLDTITYQRYVMGNWDIIDVEKPFAYAFSSQKHIKQLPKPTKSLPLYISFDFNIDPITAIVCQHNQHWIRVHREYRLKNSNIYELCEAIRRDYSGFYFYVTGDATGKASNAMVRENMNYYKVIMKELNIQAVQMNVPNVNPNIGNNRVLVNSVLEKHPSIHFDVDCKYLIEDLLYVEVNGYGDIDKTKDKHRTHLLDTFRYYINTYHHKFLKYQL